MFSRIAILGALLLVPTQALWAQARPSEDDVFALSPLARAGDRSAVRQLFELYTRSSGAVTEDIDVILGRVAEAYPVLFLQELLRSPSHSGCSNVSNTGEEFVDHPEEQRRELQARREALQSVAQSSLVSLRDSCIAQLDENIRLLSEVISMESK